MTHTKNTIPTICDTRIFMTEVADYDKKSKTVYTKKPDLIFQNTAELVDFLICKTKLYNQNNYECLYVTEQNITGNDISSFREAKIANNNKIYITTHQMLKRYWFHDKNNKTIDIRNLMPIVVNKIKSGYYPYYSLKHSTHKRKYHSHLRHKRETYRQTIKQQYDTEYEIGEFVYKLHPRKRDLTHSFVSRRSSGWKNNKYKCQWMHNQIQKDIHAANKTKKNKGCGSSQP